MSGLVQMELLQAVLDKARITQWDLLIVGDGSGTGWDDCCAYASVLVDRETRGRKTCFGGNRWGSINLAEMEAYLKPLFWFHAKFGSERLRRRSPLYVHVITDSQVTVTHGIRAANLSESLPNVAHRPLWAAMREFAHMGYCLRYHWAPRCTSELNTLSDLIAGLSRRALLQQSDEEPDLSQRVNTALANLNIVDPATGQTPNAYNVNPDEDPNGRHAPADQ